MKTLRWAKTLVIVGVMLGLVNTHLQAQSNSALLTVEAISGTIETSADGVSFTPVDGTSTLEEGAFVRWGVDAEGIITGPENFTVDIFGADFGAGELEVVSYADAEASSGIRLRLLSGTGIFGREIDPVAVEAFYALSAEEQVATCEARAVEVAVAATTADQAVVPAADVDTTVPTFTPVVLINSADDTLVTALEDGYVFFGPDETGVFSASWTVDAHAEVSIFIPNEDGTFTDGPTTSSVIPGSITNVTDRLCADISVAVTALRFAPNRMSRTTGANFAPSFQGRRPRANPANVTGLRTEIDTSVTPPALNFVVIPPRNPNIPATVNLVIPPGGFPFALNLEINGFVVSPDTTSGGSIGFSAIGDTIVPSSSGGAGFELTTPSGLVLDVPAGGDTSLLVVQDGGDGIEITSLTGETDLEVTIPEGGLDTPVNLSAGGFSVALDTTEGGTAGVTTDGTGNFGISGENVTAEVTTPSGTVVGVSGDSSEIAVSDSGNGTEIQVVAGETAVDTTNSTGETSIGLPDGSTITGIEPGETVDVAVNPDGSTEIETTGDITATSADGTVTEVGAGESVVTSPEPVVPPTVVPPPVVVSSPVVQPTDVPPPVVVSSPVTTSPSTASGLVGGGNPSGLGGPSTP